MNVLIINFHGTTHKYASQRASEITGLDYQTCKIVSCHLGNGASVAAIKNGKSIDTSMGFTPVEGLLMGNRCGDVDAGVLIYLQQNFNLSYSEIQQITRRVACWGFLVFRAIIVQWKKQRRKAIKLCERRWQCIITG